MYDFLGAEEYNRGYMKSLPLFGFLALFILIIPLGVAHAAEMQTGKTLSIPATQALTENAYFAGGQVDISSPAQKDLVVAGGKVIVATPVLGDAMLAGGTVDVLDEVKGDLRVAGGQVTIAKSVGGDLVVLGGTVTVLPGVVISGDVLALGGTVDMEGTVNGKLTARAGDITVDGAVLGPVSITARTVTFGDRATLGSTLAYSSPQEATVAGGAHLGTVTFTKTGSEHPTLNGRNVVAAFFAVLGVLLFVKFIGILVTALVTIFVFPKYSLALGVETVTNFWRMVGIGFIALIVPPFVCILLGVSLVGLYLAFILGLVYILGLLIAGIYMGIIAGALLSKWIRKEIRVDWKWTLLGTFVVFVLPFIPIVGWIAMALLLFASVGAIATSIMKDAKAKM